MSKILMMQSTEIEAAGETKPSKFSALICTSSQASYFACWAK